MQDRVVAVLGKVVAAEVAAAMAMIDTTVKGQVGPLGRDEDR